MILAKRLLISTILAGALPIAQPAAAAPWVKGFVVGAHEYAFRYGGRADFSRDGEIEPGVDCPRGASVHFAHEDRTRVAIARQKWRSQQEIDWVTAPPGLDN